MNDRKRKTDPIERIMGVLRVRHRKVQAGVLGLRSLFYGGVASLVAAGVGILAGAEWMHARPWVCLLVVPAAGMVGLLIGWFRRGDRLALARALDRAAESEDRFASALELADHHRRERVSLLTNDALSHVRATSPASVFPLPIPAEVKWLPVPALLLALVLWIGPGGRVGAVDELVPEVSPDQWAKIEESFRRDLKEEFGKPETPEEEKIAEELKGLASALANKPEKKAVLARIAKLRASLDTRRQGLKSKDVSVRLAARALRSSSALRRLASLLQSGEYKKASRELRSLAVRLRNKKLGLSAQEFETAASDFERLAQRLSQHDELGLACKHCAAAASSMNRNQLAESLDNLSSVLERNQRDLKQSDSLCRACDRLDELERRLAGMKKQCSVCKGQKRGQCQACNGSGAFVQRPGGKKGGLKAGWGTAGNWLGGKLTDQKEQRLPDVVADRERNGTSTSFSVVSKEERAQSALAYQERYAKLVQKAEADLALEDVPLAYRDFLRRYFSAIKPEEPQEESTVQE